MSRLLSECCQCPPDSDVVLTGSTKEPGVWHGRCAWCGESCEFVSIADVEGVSLDDGREVPNARDSE